MGRGPGSGCRTRTGLAGIKAPCVTVTPNRHVWGGKNKGQESRWFSLPGQNQLHKTRCWHVKLVLLFARLSGLSFPKQVNVCLLMMFMYSAQGLCYFMAATSLHAN